MRICFLADGKSVHTKRWLEYFQSQGHEVHLITFTDFIYKDMKDKIVVHKVGNLDVNSKGGNWQYLKYVSDVKQILKEIHPDIVNAHYITSYGFIAALIKFPNLVMSAWGSDILITPYRNIFYKGITKFSLHRAKVITSDSEYMSSKIRELSTTKVVTVPMGVDKKLCSLERKADNNKIRILSLRTIDTNCNISLIVKAFSLFHKEFNNSELIITNEGPEIENVNRLVTELNLQNCITMKGFINRDELLDLLLCSNMYISVPCSDSTSVTLLEAMACGTIPIVSNIPANEEWIRDLTNGLIVKDYSQESLCESMKLAVSNGTFAKSCCVINRKLIVEKADWEKNMNLVQKEFELVIEK